jgi:hypothetical protein
MEFISNSLCQETMRAYINYMLYRMWRIKMSWEVIIVGKCKQIIHCSLTAEGREPFILAVNNINVVIWMQQFQKVSTVPAVEITKQGFE